MTLDGHLNYCHRTIVKSHRIYIFVIKSGIFFQKYFTHKQQGFRQYLWDRLNTFYVFNFFSNLTVTIFKKRFETRI